ncbi:MAG: YjbQ family protein [Theionarchaea archaeon]|nr:YjbQ family protein [Theionarchaea archaeon]MBU7022203.1 YjbQ family protein [Theionarchaea archaeon]MBU7039676.1 YjbQ family protein [Theionarchaea archaeon]
MEIEIRTSKRTELIDITEEAQSMLERGTGVLVAYCTHTTAGIYVNENEAGLKEDILALLDKLVPPRSYNHDKVDHNADSHLKAVLIGNSAIIPVENGRLRLGTWQRLFFCELDGPRQRKVHFTLLHQ